MKKFIFMYLLTEDMDRIKKNLGNHVRYWKDCKLSNYQNGPFSDKSGGLIIFAADSRDKAEKLIASDPLLRQGALKKYWLKEWVS